MSKRKIGIVTGTRADYGLLYWLMKEIQADEAMQLQILVTGMHLSPEFGLTYRTIEQDGFHIDEKVEMLLSGDTPTAITKSMGLAIIGFADALERLRPDILVILGDRTEAFAAAQAAMVARIPIAHIHGGEVTEGAIDEAIRHAITKMSHLHFVAAESYRQRVIQLGEPSERVFNFGAPGIENIKRLSLRTKEELAEVLDFQLGQITFLVTYHPVTLEIGSSVRAMNALLQALDSFPQAHILFTKPNSDTDGRILIDLIEQYAALTPNRAKVFASMGQVNYLSAVQCCDAVIGNSSSGLIEVPTLHKPTVNIGQRQKGRLKAASVLDCDETVEAITYAIQKALSAEFNEEIKHVKSPYGEGATSVLIKNQLKHANLTSILFKEFIDL